MEATGGPGAATTVTLQGARTPNCRPTQVPKETQQLGLRGGNTKKHHPQGQESHAIEQQTQHAHMVEQCMH